MSYETEIKELFERIVKLPTLEERQTARFAVLDKLEDHKWSFRDEADFTPTYPCSNCGLSFEEWEKEEPYTQPPGMPTGLLCEPCWDRHADRVWAEEAEG
jgi:hypothetical protein